MDKDGYSVHHHHHHASSAGAGGVFAPSAGAGNMLERGEIVKMPGAHGVGGGTPASQGDMTLRHMPPHVPYTINGLLGPSDGAPQGVTALHHHGKSDFKRFRF